MTLVTDQSGTPLTPDILVLQGADTLPQSAAFTPVTDAINPQHYVRHLLAANFPEDIYDLSAESHLTRLFSVLLGDAGVGALRKQLLRTRLQVTLLGVTFLDLDTFAHLTGAHRMSSERSLLSPVTDTGTAAEWDAEAAKDATFLSRIEQYLKAVPFAGTKRGLAQAAQAIIGAEVDIYESYTFMDRAVQGWTSPIIKPGGPDRTITRSKLGQTQSLSGNLSGAGRTTNNRREVIVSPKRPITAEERYALIKALTRIKPADALLTVTYGGVLFYTALVPRRVAADSEYWEVLSVTTPRPGTEGLYQDATPGAEQPRPACNRYQGQAWSHLASVSAVQTYSVGAPPAPDPAPPTLPAPIFTQVPAGEPPVPVPPPAALPSVTPPSPQDTAPVRAAAAEPWAGWTTATWWPVGIAGNFMRVIVGGRTYDYTGSQALTPAQLIALARVVSGGVLATYPLLGRQAPFVTQPTHD